MPQENHISLNIPEADQVEIKAAINVLVVKLLPHLIALTPLQRQTLSKASDKSLAFLEDTKDFFVSNAELVPVFIDKEEYNIDVDGMKTLFEFFTPLNQVTSLLNDTITLESHEAYIVALAFYSSVKSAAKLNIPGAKEVYEELRKRFINP